MQPIISVLGTTMTITIALDATPTPSASGKTQVISSTRGNLPIATPSGVVYLGLNLYKK